MKEITRPQLGYLQIFEYEKTPVVAGKMTIGDSIALKPIVENLGLDWSSQRKRIERDEKFSQLWSSEKAIAADGKPREMVCLPPIYFQEWLWSLNISENLNIQLWETYKKGLVVYLMEMLKISLDEVRKLRKISNAYDELVEDTKSYFDATDESLELRKQAKEISNRQKEIRQRILAKVNIDPNQLGIEFY